MAVAKYMLVVCNTINKTIKPVFAHSKKAQVLGAMENLKEDMRAGTLMEVWEIPRNEGFVSSYVSDDDRYVVPGGASFQPVVTGGNPVITPAQELEKKKVELRADETGRVSNPDEADPHDLSKFIGEEGGFREI